MHQQDWIDLFKWFMVMLFAAMFIFDFFNGVF